VLGRTHEQALATPMHLIEGPAHVRALLQGDPGQAINPAMLLNKHVKPKLTGKDLAKAQGAAWASFIDNWPTQKRRKGRAR
jgi:hypothetical protein